MISRHITALVEGRQGEKRPGFAKRYSRRHQLKRKQGGLNRIGGDMSALQGSVPGGVVLWGVTEGCGARGGREESAGVSVHI